MSTFERREQPRATVATAAVVLARHNNGVAFTIESISTGGAKLAGPLALSVGEQIQILFDIDGHPIDVAAEVIRVDRDDILTDRIAVRFIDLEPSARAAILVLVQRSLDRNEPG